MKNRTIGTQITTVFKKKFFSIYNNYFKVIKIENP